MSEPSFHPSFRDPYKIILMPILNYTYFVIFFSFRMDVDMGGLTHLLQGIMRSDGHR